MKRHIKILIVEDEALAVMTLQDIFIRWGYDLCQPSATAEKAMKHVEEEQPDVVLIDIHLAGEMSGLEFAREMRVFSQAAIIFMTGYTDKTLKEEAMKLNPLAYLVKPINLDHLRVLIDSVLLQGKPGETGL